MLTERKRKVLFWCSVIVFLMATPPVMLYALGYRVDGDFNITKTGGLYISSDYTGSEIFVDEELKRRTNLLQGGIFIQNLTPRHYSVLVAKEGYYPWTKSLAVKGEFVTEARALLIPEEPNARIITRGKFSNINGSNFDHIVLFSEDKGSFKTLVWYLPDENEYLPSPAALNFLNDFEVIRWLSGGAVLRLDERIARVAFDLSNRRVSVIALGNEPSGRTAKEIEAISSRMDPRESSGIFYRNENRTLSAKWINNNRMSYYFSAKDEILLENKFVRNFEYYPRRYDAVIASFDTGIWAIEIDSRDGRITRPIYKGKSPEFIILPGDGRGIYVLDDGILIRILLTAKEE